MSKKFGAVFVSVFLLLFSVGFALADLAVLGTVYEESVGGNLASGSSVTVTCDGVSYSDTTGSDGQYAVLFNESAGECLNGSVMEIQYVGTGFNTFRGTKDIDYSTIANTGSLYTIVADHGLVRSSSSGSSSSGGGGRGSSSISSVCYSEFWDCGEWTQCSEGEQTRECVSNCGAVKTELQACGDALENSEDFEGEEGELFSSIENEVSDDAPQGGFLQGITGAVIGTLGTGGTFVAAVFIAIVIAGFVYTRSKAEEAEDSE